MTDLLLINPNGSAQYQGLADEFAAIEPPLWVRLIGGYVRDLGYDVKIIDAAAEGLAFDQVAERVIDADATLVCVVAEGHQPNASTQTMPAVVDTVTAIKHREPYTPVIVTGGFPSSCPNDVMESCETDYVCVGEGPVTVVGLVRLLRFDDSAVADLSKIPGLVWREGRATMRSLPAPNIDVTTLNGDVWHLLPMDKYRAHNWQVFDDPDRRQPYASIYTSLGCPYACAFCCINAPFGGNGYRMRRPASVVSEVSRLYHAHGVKTFKIVDEMFVLNDRHVKQICEGLAALDFAEELNFWAYARIDTIKPEQLPMLRKAGIRWLALGIESGSAMVRDGANKTIDEAGIEKAVRAVQDAGINVIGNFIFGLPDDTLLSMSDTLNLAQTLNCEFANFYVAMAYPGSALYKTTPAENLPSTWAGYSQHGYECTPLPTAALTAKQVLGYRDAAFHTYYDGSEYQEMILAKFGAPVLRDIEDMTAHRLKRRLLDDA